jgi:hypothetical protein
MAGDCFWRGCGKGWHRRSCRKLWSSCTISPRTRWLACGRPLRLLEPDSFFVTRAKQNFCCVRRYSRPVDKTTGLRCHQTVVLTGLEAQHDYPAPLRRIGYRDPQTGKSLVFLTNNFTVPALTIAQLYRGRWQIELFFKWIKQHLRIKALLRHVAQRGAHPNLDRHRRLFARRHSQETPASGFEPLHNVTDFEPHAF